MIKVCVCCGAPFYVNKESMAAKRKEHCDKCQRKANIRTQGDLARLAGRTINDTVQRETDKADLEGVSYGVHMARKVENHGKENS